MRWILVVVSVVVAMLSPPAFADKGMLQITSDPGGVQVLVDGERKGNTPVEAGQSFIVQLRSGEHLIELVKPGDGGSELYGKADVFVADDTVQPVRITLGKRPTGAELARLRKVPPPKMVSVPAGAFMMGEGSDAHRVVIARPFEMGVTPVTFDEWDACVADGGCDGYSPADEGWGRGIRPVIRVSWDDIQKYLRWLNAKTGKSYRLPTEAEWEYAARAGTTTKYWWGDDIGRNNANCGGCGSQWDNKQTAPVGSFKPNPFGLYDMNGNVWQWIGDCYHDSYNGAPADGSAWTTGDCKVRVLRGGSWLDSPGYLRSALRYFNSPGERFNLFGFRVARTVSP